MNTPIRLLASLVYILASWHVAFANEEVTAERFLRRMEAKFAAAPAVTIAYGGELVFTNGDIRETLDYAGGLATKPGHKASALVEWDMHIVGLEIDAKPTAFESAAERVEPVAAQKESVIEKLAKMKPDLSIKIEKKSNTAPILLYTVEGDVLDGKPAAICDINQNRIAILGADISTTQTLIKNLNLRVSGSEAEEQVVKDTQGKPFFSSKYHSTKQSGWKIDRSGRPAGARYSETMGLVAQIRIEI